MTTLFISDLHLDDSRPAVTQLFLNWLQAEAASADALYILGDLFEAYIGDDDDAPIIERVARGLRDLVDRGVPVHFAHGNRDFLLGPDFAARAGVHLLPEVTVVNLHGTAALLLHGDTLCTDDIAYQGVRQQLRDSSWQARFLAQPLAARRAFAAHARAESAKHTGMLASEITDVTDAAVRDAFAAHGVTRMIHGHTHRPAVHDLGGRRSRIVLGDWYEQGSVLSVDGSSLQLSSLPLVR
jgi:UDP-2,3-diacylglucosamine hydrolase